jgi:ATP-dependent helicase HrpB
MSQQLSLPVDDHIESIKTLLSQHQNLVITAAPGAGKTTRLPPALAPLFKGKTRVLEPRRMAAIAAAHRIAEENSWSVGKTVGYQVRFSNQTSPETKLIFMTEALLARQLLQDPELSDTDLVILDEFHERSLHVDLALGLLRELQELGRSIKIIVMSATLEAEKIAAFLGDSPIVSIPGKLFAQEIHHQKENQLLQLNPSFFERLFQNIRTAYLRSTRDILVFLPGVGEIERTRNLIEDWARQNNTDVLPLHGSLRIEDQRKALQAGARRRIILSTNVAESSVTVDGVDSVIDSGLAKVMRVDPKTGFSRLELSRISLSSAIQRAGRSARQYPGQVYRLWNKHDELNFPKSETPEIQRADLSESLLFLSAQGVTGFEDFSWFEKPPQNMIKQAENFLKLSKALQIGDHNNQITNLGKKLLHFPLPIRLGKMILTGLEINEIELACQMAALLQERDLLRKDQVLDYHGDTYECDLKPRLEIFQDYLKTQRAARGTSVTLLQTLEQSCQQILETARKLQNPQSAANKSQDSISSLLLSAYSDRLCRRRGHTDRALMIGGRGVRLQNESLVKKSEFFVALQGVEGSSESETLVSWACGLSKEQVFDFFGSQIKKTQELVYNEEKGQFYLHEYNTLQDLPLEEAKVVPTKPDEVAARLPELLSARFDAVLKENESLNQWWQRLQFLLQKNKELSLDLSSLRLAALQQASLGESKMSSVTCKDLVYFFENVFPSEVVQILKDELPEKIKVPSGSLIKIHYPLDKAPYLEVRIQEIFGLKQTPKVYHQSILLTFHLLGPNYRPVQLTSNLESFWKNGYPEVRKELRLKYPKHQWPEDPAEGVPEAKGRKRP